MRPATHRLGKQFGMDQEELERRLRAMSISGPATTVLTASRSVIVRELDTIISVFCDGLLEDAEIVKIVGGKRGFNHLDAALKSYVLQLFDGQYDMAYAQSRLRIGLAHKRKGVPPKLYIAAVLRLFELLQQTLRKQYGTDCSALAQAVFVLERVMMFDLSLVFDTYIQGLIDDVLRSKKQLEKYAQGLEKLVAQRTRQLEERARSDSMTGLFNVSSMYEELHREIARSERTGGVLSFLYIDVDGFKKVNDTRGHRDGDMLIMAIADALRQTFRTEDILSRYGGDEFCVIMPRSNSKEAIIAAERLLKIFAPVAREFCVSLSVGISVRFPKADLDAEGLVQLADKAMYVAKHRKGNAIEVFPTGLKS